MKTHFVIHSRIQKYVHARSKKQVSKSFTEAIDRFVEMKVLQAINIYDGNGRRLSAWLFNFLLNGK